MAHSELVRSSPPDQDVKSTGVPSNGSTFDRESSRSPAASSLTGSKASPTDSQSSSSQASGGGGVNGQKASRQRYDGVYYTHEPIRGAPNVEFEDKIMDVEINHRNTEV